MPITCPQCGEENKDGVVLCSLCGINIQRTTPPPAPQPRPTGTMPPPPSVVGPVPHGVPRREQGVYVEEYAGFWVRFVAYIIDRVALMILGGIVGVVAGVVSPSGTMDKAAEAVIVIVVILGVWFYYAGLESSPLQATLGKAALGLKVIDQYGERISFLRATGRMLAKILSGIILGIGYIMIGFTECKQGLHDSLASTYVVHK